MMDISFEFIATSQAVLRPVGRIDAETSPALRQAIIDVAAQGRTAVVVDLTQVEFMDSSGLSALVSGMKTLRKAAGMLAITGANPQVKMALRLTMLDRVFPNQDSVEKAFTYLESHPEQGRI
jgi:anti-sigma B factor antagonist